jgi:hypothetical protein
MGRKASQTVKVKVGFVLMKLKSCRKGRLFVPEEFFPVFQRKYLEPVADEKTEFTFASVEDVDKAATIYI